MIEVKVLKSFHIYPDRIRVIVNDSEETELGIEQWRRLVNNIELKILNLHRVEVEVNGKLD